MQHYFKLHPSRFFMGLLAAFCLAALLSLWLLPVPMWATLSGFVVILYGMAGFLLRDARLASTQSCVAFRLEGRDAIVLILRNGTHLPGRVSANSVVTPYLVILNVEVGEQRGVRSVLVLPDAMGVDSFRRLRVALRWGDRSAQAGA